MASDTKVILDGVFCVRRRVLNVSVIMVVLGYLSGVVT